MHCILFTLLLILCRLLQSWSFRPANGRFPSPSHLVQNPYVGLPNSPPVPRPRSRTSLNMVFDFLRKRSEEGLEQVANLAKKAGEGKLGEALQDTADYIQLRQRIDAENLKKLTDGLTQSRERLLGGISSSFSDADDSIEQRLLKIEEVLLQADIGATATNTILKDLKAYSKTNKLVEGDILPVLRERLIEALTPPPEMKEIKFSNTSDPTVLFVIGANGMGKTTTIGKLSNRLANEFNLTVLLGACDTFRAAAVEQLGEWAKRANVSIEKPSEQERGGDPVPVCARSVARGKEEGYDIVIIDTSGRLSNNFELTQQLQDMKAAIKAQVPAAPHETLLVVDGSLGRNAVEQASTWRKYVGIDGIIVTKLDGTARGGFVVSVVKDLGLPVKYIGVGEKIDDLREFEPTIFVDALLGNDETTAKLLQAKSAQMMGVVRESSSGDDDDSSTVASSSSTSSADRLKASFASSNSNSGGSKMGTVSDDGVMGMKDVMAQMEGGGGGSGKRKKRAKPQQSKKKKKKAE